MSSSHTGISTEGECWEAQEHGWFIHNLRVLSLLYMLWKDEDVTTFRRKKRGLYRRRAKVGSMSKKENDKEIKTGERNDDED